MRKLSFNEKVRHRLRDIPRLHRRRPELAPMEGVLYATLGAAAGIAVGMVIAQRYGGFGALTHKMRERLAGWRDDHMGGYDGHADHDDQDIALSPLEELEERVLDAYRNDPILCERAVDIGAIGLGIIELTGWVHSNAEATQAVTIARGTPGVDTVVNRIVVRDEEDAYDGRARQFADGDDSLTEAHWEGSTGTKRSATEPWEDALLPDDTEASRGD